MRLTENRTITRRAPQRSPGDRPCRGSELGAGAAGGTSLLREGGPSSTGSSWATQPKRERGGRRKARAAVRGFACSALDPHFPIWKMGRVLEGRRRTPSAVESPGRVWARHRVQAELSCGGGGRGLWASPSPSLCLSFPTRGTALLPLAILPPALWGFPLRSPIFPARKARRRWHRHAPCPTVRPGGSWPDTVSSRFCLVRSPWGVWEKGIWDPILLTSPILPQY